MLRRLITHACLALLLVNAACTPGDAPQPSAWEDELAKAQELIAAGAHEDAQFALRRALARHPDQAALHVAMARNEIGLERTDLALTSIDDAAQTGATEDTVTLLRAEAHFAAGDVHALDALPLPPTLNPITDTTVRYYRARALAEAPYPRANRIFESFYALFRHVDALDVATRTALDEQGVAAALNRLRDDHTPVARAWAHVRCADSPAPPATHWSPLPLAPQRRVLRVGPGEAFTTIAAAAAAARDGDAVEIHGGDYAGDVAVWSQSDLLIRGIDGRPHVRGAGRRVRDRDVWLFTGDDIVIENVEISGARSPKYRNGAAVRHTGENITLRHVYLHHSENGLLTGNDAPASRLLVEHAEFSHNGHGDGLSHNLYVGHSAELIVRYSYSHDAKGGHLLKSRAASTQVLYSRLSDEGGNSSYLVDVPNGGEVILLGSVLEQNAKARNKYVLSYAGEALRYPKNTLKLVNNTLYNRAYNGVFAHLNTRSPTHVQNNIAIGAPTGLVDTEFVGFVRREANLLAVEHGVRDPANFDFALTAESRAIDDGTPFELVPTHEYVHPLAYRPRTLVDQVDLGAYEACKGALEGGDTGAANTTASLR